MTPSKPTRPSYPRPTWTAKAVMAFLATLISSTLLGTLQFALEPATEGTSTAQRSVTTNFATAWPVSRLPDTERG